MFCLGRDLCAQFPALFPPASATNFLRGRKCAKSASLFFFPLANLKIRYTFFSKMTFYRLKINIFWSKKSGKKWQKIDRELASRNSNLIRTSGRHIFWKKSCWERVGETKILSTGKRNEFRMLVSVSGRARNVISCCAQSSHVPVLFWRLRVGQFRLIFSRTGETWLFFFWTFFLDFRGLEVHRYNSFF